MARQDTLAHNNVFMKMAFSGLLRQRSRIERLLLRCDVRNTSMHIIARVLDLIEHASSLQRNNVRDIYLAQFGKAIIPYCAAKYQDSPAADYRADLVRFVLRYARDDEDAMEFAKLALNDRSRKVRHHACAVLSYSLSDSALASLEALLTHRDAETVADASRAIECIKTGNHNRFYPTHSSWGVFPDDPLQPKREDVDRYIIDLAPELVAPLMEIFGNLFGRVGPPST